MPSDPAARRLLVVDDMEEILAIFQSLTRRLPSKVVLETVLDPRDAAHRLERNAYDAVVCDYRMPFLNGADLLEIARRTQPSARLAILTGYNELPDPGARRRLEAVRLDAYLNKPVTAAKLLETLRGFLADDQAALAVSQAAAREQERLLRSVE